MIDIMGQLIKIIVMTLAFPFYASGYIACHLWATVYFGWSKADAHQVLCVKRYERNYSNDREVK